MSSLVGLRVRENARLEKEHYQGNNCQREIEGSAALVLPLNAVTNEIRARRIGAVSFITSASFPRRRFPCGYPFLLQPVLFRQRICTPPTGDR